MAAPNYYFYDNRTGELVGTRAARVVPRRHGLPDSNPAKWLIPNSATITPPPPYGNEETVIWKDGGWLVVPDLRGKTAYHTSDGLSQPVTVDQLGELDPDYTLQAPQHRDPRTDEPLDDFDETSGQWVLNAEREQKIWGRELNIERERRMLVVAITYGGNTWNVDANPQARRNLGELYALAKERYADNDTTTMPFRDADNVSRDLTPQQVYKLVTAVREYYQLVMAASWAIKDADPRPTDITNDALWPAPQWPQP